jgi:glycosyltransferase involved in cell wall biosynthesis
MSKTRREPDAPTVSVVIPVYNGAALIDATIESALGQTYPHLEVIVVDDGSTDRTAELVRAKAALDPRVRFIQQTNRGVGAARNAGIAAARGELIAPLDADDLWDPSKIERQVNRLLEAGNDFGIVYSWWLWIDGDGRVLDYSPQWRVEGRAADAMLQVNFIGCASIPLFRRRDILAVGGYSEINGERCADWDLSLRIAERTSVAVVPAILVAYRRCRDSMSTNTAAMWQAHGTAIQRVRARRPDLDPALVRRSEHQFRLYLAGVCMWAGQYGQALLWGMRAMGSTLGFAVLPYVARMFAQPKRRRARIGDRTIHPGDSFADLAPPESTIPYDRIYARRLDATGSPS